jgi:hypothetical protein
MVGELLLKKNTFLVNQPIYSRYQEYKYDYTSRNTVSLYLQYSAVNVVYPSRKENDSAGYGSTHL